MPQLVIEQPGLPPMTVPLTGDEVTFGRSEENQVVLVADEVSRHHARIYRREGAWVLRDNKSLNGTYINRQRVLEKVLKNLDEIHFGSKCRLIFRDDAPAAAKTGPSPGVESSLMRTISDIRAEMDKVESSMTLIGRKGTAPNVSQTSPNADEMLRIGRAYRRLSALNRANQVMASNFDLNHRLSAMLDTVLEALEADRGFVLLRQNGSAALQVMVAREMGRELEASSPSMGIAGRAAMDGEAVLMADQSTDREFGVRDSIILGGIVSAMCVPLRIEDRILGSIYVDSRKRTHKFTEEDLELFSSLASQSAMAIDNARLHAQVIESEKRRQNLSRFLPNALVDKIINESQTLELGGVKTPVTTMFCDIRGSSNLAENLEPHALVELLNEHFTAMTEIVFKYQGTLDKYIGDEIMAVFGAPIQSGDEPFRAVCAAIEMHQRNRELNLLRGQENRPLVQMGIGIDAGEVIAGYIGSPKRMDFTVVGDRVNTAKRFCDMAGPEKIVAGQGVWDAVQGRATGMPMGTVALKGKEQLVHAFEITGLRR
ncbi:MAG: FHA domain-containing protein [Candidatus Hydrogenedentes bacterium]|nr:FHA domain-containing protein [Candidatus Hydrogenedentota bacterium]